MQQGVIFGMHPLPRDTSEMHFYISGAPVWWGIPLFLSFLKGMVDTLLLFSPDPAKLKSPLLLVIL